MKQPKSTELKRLKLRQMDERLEPWAAIKGRPVPRDGWVASVRQALGMGVKQLARRMGITASAVVQLEKREVAGAVTLGTLRRAAEAMDCKLVYAIVPKDTLDNMVRERAQGVARERLQRVGHTMKLEAQDVQNEEIARQEADLAQRLLFEWSPTLWDDRHQPGD